MIILLIILLSLTASVQLKYKITDRKLQEYIDGKEGYDRQSREANGLVAYGCLYTMYTIAALPYSLYMCFSDPSITTFGLLISNVAYIVLWKYTIVSRSFVWINMLLWFILGLSVYGS